jgi:hypothetical protein
MIGAGIWTICDCTVKATEAGEATTSSVKATTVLTTIIQAITHGAIHALEPLHHSNIEKKFF